MESQYTHFFSCTVSTHPFTHTLIHSSLTSSLIFSSLTHTSTHSLTYSSIHPSTQSLTHPPTHPSTSSLITHPLTSLFINSFIHHSPFHLFCFSLTLSRHLFKPLPHFPSLPLFFWLLIFLNTLFFSLPLICICYHGLWLDL